MKHQWFNPVVPARVSRVSTQLALCCTAGLFFLSGTAAGEEPARQSVHPEGTRREKRSVNTDSLRQAIEQLKREASLLRRKAEAIDDSTSGLNDRDDDSDNNAVEVSTSDSVKNEPVKTAPKDTVELLSKEGTHAFLESFRGKKRGARERGYGGGIGATPGMYVLYFKPVYQVLDVIASDDKFKNVTFPLKSNFQGFFTMGIIGYGAVGNGLRVGGCYQGGSRSYSTRKDDTTYTVEIKTGFGGFLFEKAAVSGNMNWYIGGIAGGATISVSPTKTTDILSDPVKIIDAVKNESNKLSAPAMLLEVHGGFTYTMVNWFHIGGDLSTPLFFSPSGFKTPNSQSVTNGFVSLNPGFRIRIILGNIG